MKLRQLFEAIDMQKTLASFGDQLSSRIREDHSFSGTPEEFIQACEQMDPSPTRKYTLWLVKTYAKGGIKFFEDIMSKTIPSLKIFDKASLTRKISGPVSDINRYQTLNDLMNFIDQFGDKPILTKKEKVTELFKTGKAKLIYDGPKWRIAIPMTEEASCILGLNTRWCTAARNDNAFDQYNIGSLIIILNKTQNTRWQFSFEEFQFVDEKDQSIDLYEFFSSNEDLLQIFKHHFSKYMPELSYIMGIDRASLDDLRNEPIRAYRLAKYINDRVPELESAIMRDPELAYRYAENIIQGAWPEGEPAIMTEPEFSYLYAAYVLGERWPEAEPIIKSDNYFAQEYRDFFDLDL